jgi:hypothetical protein
MASAEVISSRLSMILRMIVGLVKREMVSGSKQRGTILPQNKDANEVIEWLCTFSSTQKEVQLQH